MFFYILYVWIDNTLTRYCDTAKYDTRPSDSVTLLKYDTGPTRYWDTTKYDNRSSDTVTILIATTDLADAATLLNTTVGLPDIARC